MFGNDDAWIENRILRNLAKRGQPDLVHVFSSPLPVSASMNEARFPERPVVAFAKDDHWILLGANWLWSEPDGFRVRLDDIRSVRSVEAEGASKQEVSKIEIEVESGQRAVIFPPPGEPCSSLLGVLLMLVRLQKPGAASVS